MKIAVLALTDAGKELASILTSGLKQCLLECFDGDVDETLAKVWKNYDTIICIMGVEQAVRSITSFCQDSKKDPCILVIDEKGLFVISLFPGVPNRGDQFARKVASMIGGQPVITTGPGVISCTDIKIWARENNLAIDDSRKVDIVAEKLINNGAISIYSDISINSFPDDFKEVNNVRGCDVIFSHKRYSGNSALRLTPKNLVVGLGCGGDATRMAIESAVVELFEKENIDRKSIGAFATIEGLDEDLGITEFAQDLKCPLLFYSKDELNSVTGVSTSLAALSATGAKSVAEPAAILGASNKLGVGKLIVRNYLWKDVTVAIAQKTVVLRDVYQV